MGMSGSSELFPGSAGVLCVVTEGQDGGAGCQGPRGGHLSHAADAGLQHRSPSHGHLW